MVTLENYEEYIMMQADGELSAAEERALVAFLEQYPELKAEQAAYALTNLVPDETIVFADKQSLMKKVPAKRIVLLPTWGKYAIAAGVAMLICVSAYKWVGTDTQSASTVATVTTPTTATGHPNKSIAATVPGTTTSVAAITIASPTPVSPVSVINNGAVKHAVSNNSGIAVHNTPKENKNITPSVVSPNKTELVDIAALPAEGVQKIKVQKSEDAGVALIEAPEQQAVANVKKHRGLFDRLPLDEANKRQLRSIAGAVAGAYEKVSDAKDNLDNNGLTIQIPQANISLNF